MTIVPGLFLVLFLVCSLFNCLSVYMFPLFPLITYTRTGMKWVYGYFSQGEYRKRVGTTGNWEQNGVRQSAKAHP